MLAGLRRGSPLAPDTGIAGGLRAGGRFPPKAARGLIGWLLVLAGDIML